VIRKAAFLNIFKDQEYGTGIVYLFRSIFGFLWASMDFCLALYKNKIYDRTALLLPGSKILKRIKRTF
jgi:hypothetical protein